MTSIVGTGVGDHGLSFVFVSGLWHGEDCPMALMPVKQHTGSLQSTNSLLKFGKNNAAFK